MKRKIDEEYLAKMRELGWEKPPEPLKFSKHKEMGEEEWQFRLSEIIAYAQGQPPPSRK